MTDFRLFAPNALKYLIYNADAVTVTLIDCSTPPLLVALGTINCRPNVFEAAGANPPAKRAPADGSIKFQALPL